MIRTHNTGDYWVPQDTKYPVAAAGALFRNRSEPSTEEDVQLTPSQTYGVVTQENYMELSGNRVVLNTMGASNMKRVRPGDFILHLRSFQGGIELSRIAGKVSNAYTVLEPSPLVDIEYFRWLLKSDVFITGLSSLTDQLRDGQSISFGTFSKLALPLPPLGTQRRIADYLDRETGQIDETIARIDRVVDLLEERRARLHRDAFSENHPTTSLVTIAEITLGKMLDQKNTVGDPTEYLRAANVRKDGTIDLTDTKQMLMTEDERKRYELQAGDILMVEGGDAGRVALLPDDLPGLAIQKTLMRIRINDAVADPAYCYWWIDHLHKSGVLALDYSVSTIAHFTAEKAQRIRIPLPPLEVQKQTAKSLQAHNLEVEEMVNQASRLKSLLEERRSALITAAVTGRIEV